MALSAEGWRALSAPRSIAVLGASDRLTGQAFTRRFLETQKNLGYTGKIFFVNPSRDSLFDEPCYPSLSALPQQVEAVAFNLPPGKILDATREVIDHGAKALLVYSGGFSERGPSGAENQRKLRDLCLEAGLPAMGPNCLGLVNFRGKTALSSLRIPSDFKVGPIAALSQSGACAAVLAQIAGRHGLSFLASTGNEAITTMEDLIGAVIDDPGTEIIVCFIEALRRAPELFALGERARKAGKPIIVLKVGMTAAGGQVSRGHTGAMAGAGEVYRQAFDQAGIILVEDFNELTQTVDLMATLKPVLKARQPNARSCRLGILGTSGGELAAIADRATQMGVTLPEPSPETLAEIQRIQNLPPDLFLKNPVDLGTGFASKTPYHERMRAAIRAFAADPRFDVIALLQGFHREKQDITLSLNRSMLSAAAKEFATLPKPIFALASRTGSTDPEIVAEAVEAKVPMFEGAREALKALRHLERHLERQDRPAARNAPGHNPGLTASLHPWAGGIASQAETFALLERLGIAATPARKITNAAEAEHAAREIGAPAVMKIDTPRTIHKSDVGGVALDVTPADAGARFEALTSVLRSLNGAPVPGEGVIMTPQLRDGIEFYIGAKRDETFGPVVACGIGGRFLEILDRTALLVAPFDTDHALVAIERSGAKRLLEGFRGGPEADLEALARMIVKVGDLALALGDRLEVLDLNPVIVTKEAPGGSVADARLILRPQEGAR